MPAGMQVTVALVRKTTAWDAVGANANVALAGFPIRGLTLGEPVGELQVDDTFGNAQPKDADTGPINLTGDANAFMRFDSLLLPFFLFMGSAVAPVIVPPTTGLGRQHTFNWADSIDGKIATLAMDTITSVDEYPSIKVAGFVLRQVAGQPCELTFNLIANTKRYSTDSGDLPTNTTLAAVTFRSPRPRLRGQHLVVRGNAVSAAALASPTDVLQPSEITLTVNRAMVGDNVFNGSDLISEPELDNVPTGTLAMNWPVHRAQTDTLLRAAKAGTEFKFDLTWTHPDANGADTGFPYLFRVDLPRTRIGAPQRQASGPGRIPYSQTVQMLKPDVASNGMTGLVNFIRIFFQCKDTTDYSA